MWSGRMTRSAITTRQPFRGRPRDQPARCGQHGACPWSPPKSENVKKEETVIIQKFLTDGCGCDLASGSCSSTFSAESIDSYRSQCSELSWAELDMVILSQLSAFTNTSTLSVHSTKHRHATTNRQETYMHFFYGGRRVCKRCFSSYIPSQTRPFIICRSVIERMASHLDSMVTHAGL